MEELKVTVKTAEWFNGYVEELKTATINAVKKGVPKDVAMDNFESAVRSAAFDAVEIEV